MGVRLPAGSKSLFHHGDDADELAAYANLADASAKKMYVNWEWAIRADDRFVTPAPVGTYRPNAWGLSDMHGNVAEWCRDGRRPYLNRPETDPVGPATGSRVVRCGSFYSDARCCRSAYRRFEAANYRHATVGFRICVLD